MSLAAMQLLNRPATDAEIEAAMDPSSRPQFKRCLCLGVLPGRACPLCLNTRWLKRCQDCHGVGLLSKTTSNGSPRKDRCGFCMGRGWLLAKPADRPAIEAQESGQRIVRQVAEQVLAGNVQNAQPQGIPTLAPPASLPRRPGAKSKGKAAKKATGGSQPATRGRGRQPSAESAARLAALTGQTPAPIDIGTLAESALAALPTTLDT